jgi:hypothetical protein
MWEKDGFLKDSVDTNAAMKQLEIYIESFPIKLKQFSSEELSKRPAEGKMVQARNTWTPDRFCN